MPSCLASPPATQRRRSSLGSDAGHARVCRPQPLFMHLTFSPTSWSGLKPVVLLRPPRPRWLFGSPPASREGQTEFAIWTITITGGVRTQHVRDAPSNTSLAVVGLSGCRRAPGRLAVLYVVPLFVPETQLPASDSPRSPVLPAVACQPAPAREEMGGGAVSHSRFRARCALEPRLPTDRDGDASLANRPWSRPAWPARQTGLEEPPLPGVLQIDEPDACVALAHLGTANALPVPRRPMQMHAGGQTGRRLPFTASCSRHVLNLYISAKVLLSGTVLVPRRRTSRATRCGA